MRRTGGIVLSVSVALGLFFCQPQHVSAANISPGSTTLYHVIDIYHGDSVDWSSLPVGGADGLSAIYMKATEGANYTDPAISSEVAGAVGRGLKFGFYHWLHPSTDQNYVAAQASHFYDVIKNYGYSCLPALDVEVTDGFSDAVLVQSMHTFLDTFQRLSGQDIMIYANPYYVNNHFQNDTSLAKYRLWLADYGGEYVYPETPHSAGAASFDSVNIWPHWDMWQYAGTYDGCPGLHLSSLNGGAYGDGDWATVGIFINTPSSLAAIDSPRGNTYTDSVTVSGWEMARSGVSRVDFYLDNLQWLGSTSALYPRGDAQNALNCSGYYLDPDKCGFTSPAFNTHDWSDGQHTIHAAGIANDGSVRWDDYSFYTKDGAITTIDSPGNTNYYSALPVSGWMLNRSGQQRVDYYIDNFQSLGSNNGNFVKRFDVQSIVNANNSFPLGAVNSGYVNTLPLTSIGPGTHTLWVAGIGGDGTVKWQNHTFTVAPSCMCVDSPRGDVPGGNVTVSGWALEHAGIQRIDVYLDLVTGPVKRYTTSDFFSRPDVHKIVDPSGNYPSTSNSGFSLTIPAADLSPGVHTVYVAAIGWDNTVQWSVNSFTVK
ncbi:glycoside hydrolase family 25 protein [Ethanoligenens harbinense]|uniref:glycoside hydrolase family 25 protein n=1 Tax=Ethanoligenens harbinense TaxID=253239 RepID=UPI00131D99A2|nr:glycoside hydrolase family 25 protein [Ethanoligenens harbinense]